MLSGSDAPEQERRRDEDCKYGIDGNCIECHRCAQFQRIGDRPFLIPLDRFLEFFEGKNGLSEGLHDRNAADIFDCLVGHVLKRILILRHLLFHALSRHHAHDCERCDYRDETYSPRTPDQKTKSRTRSPTGVA